MSEPTRPTPPSEPGRAAGPLPFGALASVLTVALATAAQARALIGLRDQLPPTLADALAQEFATASAALTPSGPRGPAGPVIPCPQCGSRLGPGRFDEAREGWASTCLPCAAIVRLGAGGAVLEVVPLVAVLQGANAGEG